MARRRLINNKVKNGDFTDAPTLVAPTTIGNRWIDGTASGSTTNSTYGWYLIVGVANFTASLDGGILKMDATNTTGRGRVMTCPFESSTTPQNIQNYGIKVNPSTSYTLTARIKGINVVDSSSLRISVQEYASSGSLIITASSSNLPAGDSDYTTYSVTFTTPATVSYVSIYISVNTAGTVQSMWVDDVKLDTTVPTTRTLTTSRTLASNRVLTRDMGTALSFDGVASQVSVTDTAILSPTQGVTIAVFCKLNKSGTFQHLLNKWNVATSKGYQFFVRNNNTLTIQADSVNSTSNNILPKNASFLLVGTISVGSPNRIYINGIECTYSSFGTGTAITTVVDNLLIGRRGDVSTFLGGILDEPRIWNRALTATEVANMYFNNAIPRTGLVGEWLFNETTGTTALDSSGNGNNGTITSATYTTDTPLRTRNSV